ncbi:hypothetical protein F0562_008327 [Nyssa sinensis]|uniref:Glabrous enhancer-binding protein-like DBD domain-containing protein n=1 Tax=Nyssa sinensis TaxID=561372 RepID=A0A5J5A7K9_9ASTE|nr:hypothetical protein F0562_008327 [Nyssa sinensis]
MAPKRLSPLEKLPPASSSEEVAESEDISDKEDDPEEQEDQERERENKRKAESGEEESDDEEEEEEEPFLVPTPVDKKHSVQKPVPTTAPQPRSSSESEAYEGSDSESDSERSLPSPTASDFTIKPIVSKPMDGSIKPKKLAPKSAAPSSPYPSKPAAKRPVETEQKGKESRTKKSKVSNGEEEDGAIEEKKSAINRLWSEDDEIAILKGMIDFKSKKGADPYADMGAFHDFLKKSLHVDVSKNQLTDKIRRLKKKYQNNAEKGEDPVFSKPHEHKSFELSKMIWGGGARKSSKVNNSAASPSPKEVAQELALQETPKASKGDINGSEEEFCSMYHRLNESLQSEKGSFLSLPESGRNFMMERLSLIGSAKAKELEEQWNNLRIDEIELYLKRLSLTGLNFEDLSSSI